MVLVALGAALGLMTSNGGENISPNEPACDTDPVVDVTDEEDGVEEEDDAVAS